MIRDSIAAKIEFPFAIFINKLELISMVWSAYPPCRIMSYTLRDRYDETNRADEASVRQVAREISARSRHFPRPSLDALH